MLVKTSVKQNTQNALLPNTREEIVLRLIPFHSALSIFGHVGCEYYDIFRTHTLVSQFQESLLCIHCMDVRIYECIRNLEPLTDILTPTTPCTCTTVLTPHHTISVLCVYVMAILEQETQSAVRMYIL